MNIHQMIEQATKSDEARAAAQAAASGSFGILWLVVFGMVAVYGLALISKRRQAW